MSALPEEMEYVGPAAGAATLTRRLTGSRAGQTVRSSYVGKAVFDFLFAALVLVLTAPLFVVLAALVKASSPGPVVFAHERVGRNGRHFRCLKFRTMVADADARLGELLASSPELAAEFAASFKLQDDPRVTAIGRFLRKTSLDELPQFWNVLRGEMSVVGPRPIVRDELERYGDHVHSYLSVRPGITGIWQVSGRTHTTYEERVAMDVRYVQDHSLATDVVAIARTVVVMVRRHRAGAY